MKTSEEGFTIVEMVVTVIVAALMIGIFYQLFVSLVQAGAIARRDATASDKAFSLLKQYPTTKSLSGADDCAVNANVKTITGNNGELGDFTQTLSTECPYVVASPAVSKVTSKITYKNNSLTIIQVNYVN